MDNKWICGVFVTFHTLESHGVLRQIRLDRGIADIPFDKREMRMRVTSIRHSFDSKTGIYR